MACIRGEAGEDYSCRANVHTESFERSAKPFNNATKQDRYKQPFQGRS